MKTYVGPSKGLSKRLGRFGKAVGKFFRGCGSFSLVCLETTKDAFLCVVCDRVGKGEEGKRDLVHTVTGGLRMGKTRRKGYIPFRALLKKNFPLCLA